MTTTNDGGPAFPFPSGPEPRVNQFHDRHEGMSLRDYFAAKAMQAIISTSVRSAGGGQSDMLCVENFGFTTAWVPATAYAIADAMLAERAKKGGAT